MVLALSISMTAFAQDEQPEGGESAAPDYGMQVIDSIGLKPAFDDLGLQFYGWVAQSFTFNGDRPNSRINGVRVFDDRSNDYLFNQFVVNFERALSDGSGFDIGGKIELMYGSDARFTHELGLADTVDENMVQFDPEQFYIEVRLPVGNGLTVKAGKYVTMLGAEVIDAPGNALYSRSFLFGFAIPFTHTGVQFDYPLTDQLSVYYGLVIGWDVFSDANNTLSHMFGGAWTSDDDKLNVLINIITGPERTDENTDLRTVFDLVATYQWTEKLSTTMNFDFGNESGTGAGGTDNNWWGIAGYATYTICPQVAATVRGEYFRDATASRLGFTGDLYEVTAGLDIRPFKEFANLRVRPEVRWDYAAGDTPFDDGSDQDQVTFALDMIITF